jgi:hypothetical protein
LIVLIGSWIWWKTFHFSQACNPRVYECVWYCGLKKWKTKNTTPSEQCINVIKKYHTVGTVHKCNKKNTTPSEQCIKWYFLITFMHCSDGVVFFDYIYTLFRRCGIFWLHLYTVPTVWYFLLHLCTEQCINVIKKYHAVGTVHKCNQKIPHRRNSV